MTIRIAILSMSLLTAGCAIHPLPDDVTAMSTTAIVQRIRCEARAGILYELGKYLRDEIASKNPDPKVKEVYSQLEDRNYDQSKIDYNHFSGKVKDNIEKFGQTAIAFNFTFDITESNGASAGLDGLALVSGGLVNIGGQVGGSLTRQNIRSFTVVDRFDRLILGTPRSKCSDSSEFGNLAYPVTGKVGVDEMIATFVGLTAFQHLGGPPADGKGPPTMADTLVFTTTVSGSVSPKVTLAPVRRGIVDASVSASGSRVDVHKVIVGLSLPDLDPPKSEKDPKDGGGRSGGTYIGALVTASGSNAEINAARAIQQQIFRFDLRGATIVVDGNGALVR